MLQKKHGSESSTFKAVFFVPCIQLSHLQTALHAPALFFVFRVEW